MSTDKRLPAHYPMPEDPVLRSHLQQKAKAADAKRAARAGLPLPQRLILTASDVTSAIRRFVGMVLFIAFYLAGWAIGIVGTAWIVLDAVDRYDLWAGLLISIPFVAVLWWVLWAIWFAIMDNV